MYTLPQKTEIVDFARTHTVRETTNQYGVSATTLRIWCRAAGFEPVPDKIGAPKGNLNMLGGRITNPTRILASCPLHRKG